MFRRADRVTVGMSASRSKLSASGCQSGGAETGPASRGVQVESIPAAQAAKGPFAGLSGGQERPQLIRRQLPPIMAAVHLALPLPGEQRIVVPAAVLHQPATEDLR